MESSGTALMKSAQALQLEKPAKFANGFPRIDERNLQKILAHLPAQQTRFEHRSGYRFPARTRANVRSWQSAAPANTESTSAEGSGTVEPVPPLPPVPRLLRQIVKSAVFTLPS